MRFSHCCAQKRSDVISPIVEPRIELFQVNREVRLRLFGDALGIIVLENYYPDNFPSFWEHLNALAAANRMQSVSEVWKKLNRDDTREFLVEWIMARQPLFLTPDTAETEFVAGSFAVPALPGARETKGPAQGLAGGGPVGDANGKRCIAIGSGLPAQKGDGTTTARLGLATSSEAPKQNMERNSEGWLIRRWRRPLD